MVSHDFPVALARGKHLFPFRTEKLSPSAPMVLGPQGPGRVGRRRFFSCVRPPPPGGLTLSEPLSNCCVLSCTGILDRDSRVGLAGVRASSWTFAGGVTATRATPATFDRHAPCGDYAPSARCRLRDPHPDRGPTTRTGRHDPVRPLPPCVDADARRRHAAATGDADALRSPARCLRAASLGRRARGCPSACRGRPPSRRRSRPRAAGTSGSAAAPRPAAGRVGDAVGCSLGGTCVR